MKHRPVPPHSFSDRPTTQYVVYTLNDRFRREAQQTQQEIFEANKTSIKTPEGVQDKLREQLSWRGKER